MKKKEKLIFLKLQQQHPFTKILFYFLFKEETVTAKMSEEKNIIFITVQ